MLASYYKGKRPPSFVIGSGPKAHVDLTTRRIVPGPGSYAIKSLNRSGITFGRSNRNQWKSDAIPGPGQYKVPVKFADVPKYLI